MMSTSDALVLDLRTEHPPPHRPDFDGALPVTPENTAAAAHAPGHDDETETDRELISA